MKHVLKNHHFLSETLIQSQQRLTGHLVRTPVITNDEINRMCRAEVQFKCENLQKTGSFKVRGAFNAIFCRKPKELKNGVATHSSGNHAQAVTLAAKTAGIPAYIVMPENSPLIKVRGVEEKNGSITFCEPTLQARENTLQQILEKTGAFFIPPYDHPDIICGQSTVAQEIFSQIPNVDAILAPLGGGGLLSGTGLAARFFAPGTRVFGAEPESVNDGFRSFKSGKVETNPPEAITIADGLRTHLSPLTLDVIRNHIEDIFTVNEASIADAMEMIWSRLKIVVEPSAAVPFAALLQQQQRFEGQKVAVILSGGNVDLAQVPFL